MKRILTIMLSAVLLLVVLAACGTTPAETTPTPTTPAPTTPAPTTPTPTTPVVTTPVPTTPAPTTPAVTTPTLPPPAPPATIYFRSLDEVRELKSMLEEDDATVETYLRSSGNSYAMNGLSSKDDINQFFDTVGNLKLLFLDSSFNYSLYISYIPSQDIVSMTYGEDGWLVVWIVHTIHSDTVAITQDPVLTMRVGDKEIGLSHLTTNSRSSFIGFFPFENGSMKLEICRHDADAAKSTFDGKFIITTLNELIEK